MTLTVTNAYNNRLQPVLLSAGTTAQTVYSHTMCYASCYVGAPKANNGNILEDVDNVTTANTATYSYDTLNRLSTAQTASTWGDAYSYDPFGNLYQKTPIGNGVGENLVAQPTAQNQLSGTSLVYDAAGNVLKDNFGTQYTYDAESRVASAGAWTYTYDGDGNRTLRTAGGSTGTTYWYGPDGSLTDEQTVAGSPYPALNRNFYLNGHMVFRSGFGNGPQGPYPSLFLLYDQVGSNRVTIDASAGTVTDTNYYPFGGYINQPTDILEQRFTGKERDAESGLDYFGARYYAASMGRWMSPDWSKGPEPIPFADLSDPQSLNLYMYGGNNPLSSIDFDGHNWFKDFAQGLADSTYRPIVHMVEHPIATAEGIGTAVAHPVATGKAIGSAVVGTVEAAAHGDGRAIGQIVGTVGTAIAGGAVARGVGVAGEVGAEAGEFVGEVPSVTTESTIYMPAEDLPRDAGGNFSPLPEAQGPHTTLGTKVDGSAGPYRRAMTFDENGKPTGRYDFTDHGRPGNHPNPHYHPIDPNTGKVGGAQDMPQ